MKDAGPGIRFWKYHGLGNDFVLLDEHEAAPRDASFVRAICDRHRGVGADGVLYLSSSDKADAKMVILNSDGSEAEMCGNGIRCAAKHLHDAAGRDTDRVTLETEAGVLEIEVQSSEGRESTLKVDMGPAVIEGRRIPIDYDGAFVGRPVRVGDTEVFATAVSMGNPHLVTFDSFPEGEIERLGPLLSSHPLFPRGANVEFAVPRNGGLKVRVYERGSGWTQACGTGACAAAAAAALQGLAPFGKEIDVLLPGGRLGITVIESMNQVMMSGPARLVFKGVYLDHP